MNTLSKLLLMAALGLFLSPALRADDESPVRKVGDTKVESTGATTGSPVKKQPRDTVGVQLPPSGAAFGAGLTPASPLPFPSTLSPEVKTLVNKFQADRQAYLKKQAELQKLLKSSSSEQRQELRDQLNNNLDKWKSEQLELRQDIRDHLNELKGELSRRDQLLNDAKEASKDHRAK